MTGGTQRRGKVVVTGILFWYPLAGVTFQFLHYLVGLQRLGYDVYYVEDPSQWVYDPVIHDLTPDASRNVATIAPILEEYGFKDRWAFRGNYRGGKSFGMSKARIKKLYREADVLLNVTGQEVREEHRACPLLVYVETDPVSSQVKVVQGDEAEIAKLAAHDIHFSYGENLGSADCLVPVERFTWLPTRQPVMLDLWDQPFRKSRSTYTTIATWQNPAWKDVVINGEKYFWSKEPEFRKIIDLPAGQPVGFELAMRVEPEVRTMLGSHGWGLADAYEVTRDMRSYLHYVQTSRGEFTVAKDQNIRLRSGWFSDRSACYLAAGRPVITQETGFTGILPTGRGLFGWRTADDIQRAVDAIESDYEGHCRDAREIARNCFAAETVLTSMAERAGF
jgi:hypothetical protein